MQEEAGVNLGIDMDFNAEEEAVDIPYLAEGVYTAKIQSVSFKANTSKGTILNLLEIVWVLENNGGMYPSTDTPIDGAKVRQNIWLPRPGDEKEMSSDGKLTKKQSKLNRLRKFSDVLGLRANTPTEINEAIMSGSWSGTPARVTIKLREDDFGIKEEVSMVAEIPE